MNRLLRLSLVLPVLLLAVAAPSQAASATVTGDSGSPVALDPSPTIRNMSPQVGLTFAADEVRYGVDVLGPGGASAASGPSCSRTAFASAERVNYQGNGTYTVVVRVSKDEEDSGCATTTEQRFTFTIAASTAIGQPNGDLLTRRPGETSLISFTVPVDLNPGADGYELRYALGATLGPDGGIAGDASSAFVDTAAGTASVSFGTPGRWTMVMRARVFTSEGERFTAWSAPVFVNVFAPFDAFPLTFPDARGPSYRISAKVREPSARGKVTVHIARGAKGGKFRRLGTTRIRRGKVSIRFRLRRRGVYRIRFTYAGNATVAAGTWSDGMRIRRVFT